MLREVFWGGADDVRHAPNIPSDLSKTSLRVIRVERAENCLSDPATCSEHALSLFLSQLSRWCPPPPPQPLNISMPRRMPPIAALFRMSQPPIH